MTSSAESSGLTLAFYGTADRDHAPAARAFEDHVLVLLPLQGGRVLFRGHRRPDEPDSLHAEFHVLWFPSEAALSDCLADEQRIALIEKHGDVFREKGGAVSNEQAASGP